MIDGTDLAKALDICANRVYAEILVAYLKTMEEREQKSEPEKTFQASTKG